MGPRFASTFAALAALTASLFSTSASAAFVTSYCSTQNTASTDDFHWDWQSNGKCTDHCNALGTYAFAVIKYTECWCSNYIPASQTDTSQCQVDCPGFPSEKCGDKDKDLFIYIKLAGSPSGTQGASQPTSAVVSSAAPVPSSTERPSSSEAPTPTPAPPQVVTSIVTPDPETVIQTVTGKAPIKTVYPSPSPSSTSTSIHTAKSSPTPSPSPSPSTTLQTVPAVHTTPSATDDEPMTVPTVVTESGVVITRTVVITPSSAPASSGHNKGSSNTGAIVGGVVGGVVGMLAIAGGVLFLLWRRRKQRQQREDGDGDGSGGITRNVSTMSKAGLLGTSREKNSQHPSPIITNFGSQRSRHDNESISPMTASDRRYSQPILVDSRLNPRAVLAFHGNDSRESIGTIDDSRDYGRQLNVVNPDLSHRD